jgi:hypothetical protein
MIDPEAAPSVHKTVAFSPQRPSPKALNLEKDWCTGPFVSPAGTLTGRVPRATVWWVKHPHISADMIDPEAAPVVQRNLVERILMNVTCIRVRRLGLGRLKSPF